MLGVLTITMYGSLFAMYRSAMWRAFFNSFGGKKSASSMSMNLGPVSERIASRWCEGNASTLHPFRVMAVCFFLLAPSSSGRQMSTSRLISPLASSMFGPVTMHICAPLHDPSW
jgi:hypothetical protein